MTKGAALHEFFNSFGIPGYPISSVPEDALFPWLTYEVTTGSLDSGGVGLTVNLWYYGESESIPNAKAQEIADYIGYSGRTIAIDDGYIWIKRGAPWSQNIRDEADANIKRRYINITVEYLTLN